MEPFDQLRDTDTLRTGDLSRCRSQHTRERCVQLHNKTVGQAKRTLVTHHSGATHYPTMEDIKYSVRLGNMTAHRAHAYTADSHKPDDNDSYAPPRTTLPQYIPDDMGRDIESVAELDPFAVKHTSGIELEVEGKTLRLAFQLRDQPHAFAATQTQETKTLPAHSNLVVASHKDFLKLSKYARYEDILKSIEAEYNRFDTRGIWELVELPDGQTAHDYLLLIKVKLKPDGTEDKIKSRCVIRGDRMVDGVHYTDTFAPTTGLTAVRCLLSNTVV